MMMVKLDDRFREFVDDTISFFKMDLDPLKWNDKNISDWFYWIRHKLRFHYPKINKELLDLRTSEVQMEEYWVLKFGEGAGPAMYKEYKTWLLYRDEKRSKESTVYTEMKLEKERIMQPFLKRNYDNNIIIPRRRNEKKDGLYLWQILLRLLLDSNYQEIISWTDYPNGKFKILNPEEVSKIWGKSKGNLKMTYDKMSRSMRQYYKSKLLIKTNRDKLNYCFNMNDLSVKKFTHRCLQNLPTIKNQTTLQLYPEL